MNDTQPIDFSEFIFSDNNEKEKTPVCSRSSSVSKMNDKKRHSESMAIKIELGDSSGTSLSHTASSLENMNGSNTLIPNDQLNENNKENQNTQINRINIHSPSSQSSPNLTVQTIVNASPLSIESEVPNDSTNTSQNQSRETSKSRTNSVGEVDQPIPKRRRLSTKTKRSFSVFEQSKSESGVKSDASDNSSVLSDDSDDFQLTYDPSKENHEKTEREIEIQKQLEEMKMSMNENDDKLEVIIQENLPIYFVLFEWMTLHTTYDHLKAPFHSETILKTPWKEMTGKRPMALRMEKHILELMHFFLKQCPVECSPTDINKWNILFVKCIAKNVFSNDKALFTLALQIFEIVASKYRLVLKKEIVLILDKIIFFYIKSPLSHYLFKQGMIEHLKKMCDDIQFMVDIFLNYDCSKFGINIYEELLTTLHFVLTPEFKMESPEEMNIRQMTDIRKIIYVSVHTLIDAIKKQMLSLSELETMQIYEINNGIKEEDQTESVERLLEERRIKVDIVKSKELFKEKPNDGVNYMINAGLCEKTPEAIAKLLKEMDGLDKTSLGKYLTTKKELNEKVFAEYIQLVDFSGLSVDEGLRKMFNLFVMPGEGQVVDRVMETFAKRYAECWSDKMKELGIDNNQVYFIATTIIFLSTETHNANVKQRTMDTYEKFKGMIEQFDFTLPDDYLRPLYDSVTQNAFLIPKQESTEEADNTRRMQVQMIRQNPLKREELLMLTSTVLDSIDNLQTSENDLLLSISNKKILKAFIDSTIPIVLKCLKLEYEIDFNECLKYINKSIELTTTLECVEMTAEIMKLISEWSVYNNFINCKPQNVTITKTILEKCQTIPLKLHEGWLYAFTVISRLQQMNFIDYELVTPLQTIPRNSRTLFYLEINHKLYQPKDIKIPPIVQLEYNTAKKELSAFIERLPLVDEAIINMNEVLFEECIKCLTIAALTELNCIQPPMILLDKFGSLMKNYINLNKTIQSKSLIELTRSFLLQVMLHPHDVVANKGIEIFFELAELDIYKDYIDIMKPIVIVMGDSPLDACRVFILNSLMKVLEKQPTYLSSSWKEIFEILFIASLDNSVSIKRLGFDVIAKFVELNISIDEKFHIYFIKLLVKYSITKEKHVVEDQQGEITIAAGMNRIMQKYDPETVDFSLDSNFFDLYMYILSSYMIITRSDNVTIFSMPVKHIVQHIDTFSKRLTIDMWYYIYNSVIFKMLHPIGYYHQVKEELENTRCDEWWLFVCSQLLSKGCEYISKMPDLLQPFVGDFIHVIITMIVKGNPDCQQLCALSLKMLIAYFIENSKYLPMFSMMVEDVLNYMYQSALYHVKDIDEMKEQVDEINHIDEESEEEETEEINDDIDYNINDETNDINEQNEMKESEETTTIENSNETDKNDDKENQIESEQQENKKVEQSEQEKDEIQSSTSTLSNKSDRRASIADTKSTLSTKSIKSTKSTKSNITSSTQTTQRSKNDTKSKSNLQMTTQEQVIKNIIPNDLNVLDLKISEFRCKTCEQEIQPFDLIVCPFCNECFCCVECKEKHREEGIHKPTIKYQMEHQFIPHKIKENNFNIVETMRAYSVILTTINDDLKELTALSKEEDTNIIIFLLTAITMLIQLIQKLNTLEPKPSQINDIEMIKEETENHLAIFSHHVCSVYPIVIVNLLNEYLCVESDTILLLALELVKECDDEHLRLIHQQSFLEMIQLIKNDNKEIRETLTEALALVYKAIEEK